MRRIGSLLMILLCVCLLANMAFAATSATGVKTAAVVSANGQCQMSMTVTLHLDSPASNLTVALPKDAKNVSVNGTSVRTYSSPMDPNAVLADLSSLNGVMGDYVLMFSYSLPDVLKTVEKELIMEIPLLSGFEFPIDSMSFTVTMPGEVNAKPGFTSGVMQTSIESIIDCQVSGQMISGTLTRSLQDRETITLRMTVDEEMFPGKLLIAREGNPEIIPMSICAGLALIYWIIFMRTLPVIRHRRTILIEGVTAGELGSRLTAAGSDLTMMVFTWAQLGYIRILLDKHGSVYLEKRMDMGNERDLFENRCFHALFARGNRIEATGKRYAQLCRQTAETVSGVREMYTKLAGNIKIFRALFCGISLFCGICFAMTITLSSVMRTIFAIVFVILGVATAWGIQDGMYKIHVRGKVPVLVGFICIILWVVVGILSGQWLMGLITVLAQILGGLLAAYGGRRSELGRYNAGQILGVRHYLKHMTREEALRQLELNPDYFFEMLPYAIALGVDGKFAKAFTGIRIPECGYLLVRVNEKRSAEEWALLLRKIADRMDYRQRRMELERWIPINIRMR